MKLYNSLTGKTEPFKPLKSKTITMYVCGITPYDTTHLGHAFTYVMFDTLVRYLRYKKYTVIYTQNVTDIDDDVLKKAKEEKKDWKEMGDFWTQNFLFDMKALNVLPPTHYVKATDSIASMIRIIEVLLEKGVAYQKNGNVYFEVKKFKEYGKLSKLTRSHMMKISKERGANLKDPLKKDPLDFVLWQKSKAYEPFWDSPWSKGRPGWHIECSVMVYEYLGKQIDIHGGGHDLIFPHHESEIAQSESLTGKVPFVKYWMHTAMLRYQGEKMSKSIGNLIMVKDLLKRYDSNTVRLALLYHHYRSPWEFIENYLIKAEQCMSYVQKALDTFDHNHKKSTQVDLKNFEKSIEHDLDIPKAIKSVFTLSERMIQGKKKDKVKSEQSLLTMLEILGISSS